MEYIEKKYLDTCFELLNESNVEYMYIDGVWAERMDIIPNGSCLDVLVKHESRQELRKFLYENGFLFPPNIYGQERGWKFETQLSECDYVKLPRVNQDVYMKISEKLCCQGISEKVWIPVGQDHIEKMWETRVWNEEIQVWLPDDCWRLGMMIVKSVFQEHFFSDEVKNFIECHTSIIEDIRLNLFLHSIFFAYTEYMLRYLRSRDYEMICEHYITFMNY